MSDSDGSEGGFRGVDPQWARIVWGALVLVLLVISGAYAWKWFQQGTKARPPLPVYGQLPEFQFVSQQGQPFGSQALKGKVWLADFIFTRCAGPCPVMTMRLSEIQKLVQGMAEVKLVTFSVDPEYDSPSVLKSYAEQFGADFRQWTFLTGPMEAIHKLARGSFKVGVEKKEDPQADEGQGILHSTYFMLVDRQGRLRGYYDTADPKMNRRLLVDLRTLLQEKTP